MANTIFVYSKMTYIYLVSVYWISVSKAGSIDTVTKAAAVGLCITACVSHI